MKITPTPFIVAICLAATCIPLVFTIETKGLELAECAVEPKLETVVNFLVSNSTLEYRTKEEMAQKLEQAITRSNWILSNSCIPMSRKLGDITYLEMSSHNMDQMFQLINDIERKLGQQYIENIRSKPNHYYGLVLTYKDGFYNSGFIGATDVELDPQFFTIHHEADEYTVEHELGHLAWAWHDDTSYNDALTDRLHDGTKPVNQSKINSYARGATCGDAGTVMAYSFKRIPIYSSPAIFYQGEACGDAKTADNARQLREYARNMRDMISVESPQG